jgi:hypothetical protein
MRYFTISSGGRAWYEYEPDVWAPRQPLPITVTTTDAIPTGILDEHGAPIMRCNDRIGFLK